MRAEIAGLFANYTSSLSFQQWVLYGSKKTQHDQRVLHFCPSRHYKKCLGGIVTAALHERIFPEAAAAEAAAAVKEIARLITNAAEAAAETAARMATDAAQTGPVVATTQVARRWFDLLTEAASRGAERALRTAFSNTPSWFTYLQRLQLLPPPRPQIGEPGQLPHAYYSYRGYDPRRTPPHDARIGALHADFFAHLPPPPSVPVYAGAGVAAREGSPHAAAGMAARGGGSPHAAAGMAARGGGSPHAAAGMAARGGGSPHAAAGMAARGGGSPHAAATAASGNAPPHTPESPFVLSPTYPASPTAGAMAAPSYAATAAAPPGAMMSPRTTAAAPPTLAGSPTCSARVADWMRGCEIVPKHVIPSSLTIGQEAAKTQTDPRIILFNRILQYIAANDRDLFQEIMSSFTIHVMVLVSEHGGIPEDVYTRLNLIPEMIQFIKEEDQRREAEPAQQDGAAAAAAAACGHQSPRSSKF